MNVQDIFFNVVLPVAASFLFMFVMYIWAQSKKFIWRFLFFSLTLLPVIIGIPVAFMTVFSSVPLIGTLIAILIIERLIWVMTLNRAAGEDQFGWFIIVWYIPVVGWLFYWIGEML